MYTQFFIILYPSSLGVLCCFFSFSEEKIEELSVAILGVYIIPFFLEVAAKTIGAIRGKDMEKTVSQSTGTCKPLTTFVQTDTNAFREIVQRLTGPSESDPPAPKVSGVRRSTSKLHERRQYLRPKLEIIKPATNFRPCTSPSPVGTPSSVFSKLSIQEKENKEASAALELNNEEEEKAIKERRFYLHPSPRSKPGYSEPELLTLFPLTSPTTSEKP